MGNCHDPISFLIFLSSLKLDLLGEDIEGKSIPQNYWKDKSVVKKIERELYQDSVMQTKQSMLDSIVEEKNTIALNASLSKLNTGRYDTINSIYYERLTELLKNTKYAVVSDFYRQRDEHIALNIIKIIRNNPGKKMIFLVGADHRSYSLKRVNQKFGNQILLNIIFDN